MLKINDVWSDHRKQIWACACACVCARVCANVRFHSNSWNDQRVCESATKEENMSVRVCACERMRACVFFGCQCVCVCLCVGVSVCLCDCVCVNFAIYVRLKIIKLVNNSLLSSQTRSPVHTRTISYIQPATTTNKRVIFVNESNKMTLSFISV